MMKNKIEDEFLFADFFDQRLNKRGSRLLNTFYENVGNSIPGACKGKTEIEAAYRFFGNKQVNPNRILAPHMISTIERIKKQDLVLLVQDSTDINAKHMEKVEGLGFINDTTRPGCISHTMIACTPNRLCLGVISNKFIIREKEKIENKNKETNKNKDITEKESYKWIEAYKKGIEIAKKAPKTKFICVADREADLYELFLEVKKEKNRIPILVRAFQNRNIELLDNDRKIKTKIKKASSELSTIGKIKFTIPKRKNKKSKVITQSIKTSTAIIKPPKWKRQLGEIEIQILILEEINPPKGEKPISWILLTTLPISNLEEAKIVVNHYLARWSIEVFFHVLKTGCKIEKLQFKNSHNLLNCVTLFMIISWRVLFVTFLGRNCPKLSCALLFDKNEWQSVYAVVKKKKPPSKPPNLGEVTRMTAMLGGFLGRKCDKEPGPKVMWKGLQALYNCVQGWEAFKNFG